MHSRPHNIIFDWSGTLVDDLPPVLEATNAVMRTFGRAELSREEFRAQFRLPFLHWYEEILPGVTAEELDSVFLAAFAASEQPVTVLPHAREFLEHCADAGRRMFVLSSSFAPPGFWQAHSAEEHSSKSLAGTQKISGSGVGCVPARKRKSQPSSAWVIWSMRSLP